MRDQREGLARMLISSLKLPSVQLYLQARAIWRGSLGVVLNQFARATLVAVLVVPAVARADVAVPGEDASGYQAAVQLWLDGADDLEALRQLSGLANEGNTAAQVLLARIGGHSHLISHVTDGLPRNERVALLRQPGGLSGRSWLEAAAEASPLASALSDSADREMRAEAVRPLFEMGETAVATRAFAALFNNGQGDLALDIVNSGVVLPPEAAFFFAQMVRGGQIEAGAYLESALIPRNFDAFPTPLAMTWAPVPLRDLLEDQDQQSAAIECSMHVPEFQPLADLCRASCPSEVAECAAAGAAELWLAYITPFASPSQALTPDEIYWAQNQAILTSGGRQLEECRLGNVSVQH